jgi:hypothetical protein
MAVSSPSGVHRRLEDELVQPDDLACLWHVCIVRIQHDRWVANRGQRIDVLVPPGLDFVEGRQRIDHARAPCAGLVDLRADVLQAFGSIYQPAGLP